MNETVIRIDGQQPAQILRKLRGYAPFGIFAAFVAWVFLVGAMSALFPASNEAGEPRIYGLLGSLAIVVVVSAGLIAWTCRGYSQCRMEIRGDRLIITAPAPGRIQERWIAIPSIQEITLGAPAGRLEEHGFLMALVAPVVILTRGATRAAVVFEESSIITMFTELANRGVKVRSYSADD